MKRSYLIYSFLVIFLSVKTYGQRAIDPFFEKFDLTKIPTLASALANTNENKALQSLLKHYREKDNLYLHVSPEAAAKIKSNYPQKVEQSITVANQVLDQYFLFRYDWDMEKTNIPHQFRGEIDWTAIPNGDEEWCFMLNRHRYWVDLGKAYFFTGKEKYAKAFVDQATHWIANNPLKDELKHLSWRRIETGIRAENWIKTFEFVKHSKHITPQFLKTFLSSLNVHAEYLNSSFSNFSQTSNWGVLEFHGLYNLAVFLNEFKAAPKWQTDAISNLTTCINLQILPDGTQWEQSPMYHNEVFHCYMNLVYLANQQSVKLPDVILQKTKAMAYANIKWQKPNYHQPLLGDSDDTDLRGLLTFSAYLFQDPVLKSRAFPKVDYENYFALGEAQAQGYEALSTANPDFLSVFQQSSGDVYMRTSWDREATYCSFHLKKLGCGHGHDNLLHFTIHAHERDYLVDTGRYTYVDNDWRELFKGNQNHNTLGVDGLPNTIYQDSWINSFEARSQGVFTHLAQEFDYAEAENSAYARLKDPVSVKRRLLFLKPNVWLVVDSFSAHDQHTYSQYFNFPNTEVALVDGTITTTYPDRNLKIQPLNPVEAQVHDSWYSPEYNLKTESKRAELSRNAKGFTSFITLLYFPDETPLRYTKTPVYNRNNVLLSDEVAEAVTLDFGNRTMTLLVVHQSPAPAAHFFKVNDRFLSGEVVLLESNTDTLETKIHILKE